jgi:diketogulonate reductase-like aldo/keto reductase
MLNNGLAMPRLGFGTWRVGQEAVETALATGYRSVDTAAAYGNEAAVGRAIAQSGVPRDEIFVTTKVPNACHGYEAALRAVEESLAHLGLDVLDLCLIHWPQPRLDRYAATWRALERVLEQGRARAIGVSNFQPQHLRRLFTEGSIVPAVNQIELHPHHAQAALRRFHARHGVTTVAWSPIARGGNLLREPVITSLATRHGRTPAQIVLRWHLELGNIVIPRSSSPHRIRENADVLAFRLGPDEVASISQLDRGHRIGPDPLVFS